MTQLVIVVIDLANVTLVVEVISLKLLQDFASNALVDVLVVLIMIIVDAVLLDSGQMNMFASHARLDVLFAGLLLIAILVFVDGTLINAALVLLHLFLVSHAIPNVSDVLAYMIVWSVEVATSLVKDFAKIVVHSVQFVKMRIFAQFVIKDTTLVLIENV